MKNNNEKQKKSKIQEKVGKAMRFLGMVSLGLLLNGTLLAATAVSEEEQELEEVMEGLDEIVEEIESGAKQGVLVEIKRETNINITEEVVEKEVTKESTPNDQNASQ